MSRVNSISRKSQKKLPVRFPSGKQRSSGQQKRRKFFTTTKPHPQVVDEYKVVKVKCQVPSPKTGSLKNLPEWKKESTVKGESTLPKKISCIRKQEGSSRKEIPLVKKETIVMRKKAAVVKKEPPLVQKQLSSKPPFIKMQKSTHKMPVVIKNEYEEKARIFREKQQIIRDRYSSPRMKELYVNPNNRNKLYRRISSPLTTIRKLRQDNTLTSKSYTEETKSKAKFETDADTVLAEAHRMIWSWLFNGLIPTISNRKNNNVNNTP